jgi:hypothetical protein
MKIQDVTEPMTTALTMTLGALLAGLGTEVRVDLIVALTLLDHVGSGIESSQTKH